MELHQLRYLVAVARTGNFSRAAEQCHVAQPSLSQQIQKLESELGERLFDRLPRRARLTEAGSAFLPRAERILAEVDDARREVREAKDLMRGAVTVGVLPTIAPYFLPRVVAAFSQAFPGVEVVVQEDTTDRLLKLGGACELDLAIVSLPIADERFAKETLFTEELLLAMPAGHRLATKRKVRLADLESEKFILMKEGHCLGDQVLTFCGGRDFHPHVSCRSAQIETVQALVRAGLGISLVPKMAVNGSEASRPVYRSLADPRPSRAVAVIWPKQRQLSRSGTELLKHLRQLAREWDGAGDSPARCCPPSRKTTLRC
jgi:LysR family hydrogen peroxide-inducible transcriptional activator